MESKRVDLVSELLAASRQRPATLRPGRPGGAGLRVPDDLSVVGFDDSFPAVGTSPPLTTVRQPLTGMARLAMRTTVTWLDDKHRSTPHLQMSTMLIERDTTGAVLP